MTTRCSLRIAELTCGAALLCACSGSSGNSSQPDSGSLADATGGSDGAYQGTPDDDAQGIDGATTGSSSGSTSSSGGSSGGPMSSDAAAIPFAAACTDGGKTPATPTGHWTTVTNNLAGLGSECGNLSFMGSSPYENLLLASVAQQGLWASTNGGTSWTQLGKGSGSAVITNRGTNFVFDPAHTNTFWESGIYNAGGVYETTDNGSTFAWLGNVTQNDSVSVDFTDPNRQTLLAGTHEGTGRLLRSTNGGSTWTDIGPNLPSGTTGFSSEALVIDSMIHMVGTYNYNDTGSVGIFRTTDGGTTWKNVFASPVYQHPIVTGDGTIYWSLDGNRGLAKSDDKGATWALTAGAGVLSGKAPVELPDGRLAAVGPNGVLVSADCGSTWHAATTSMPISPWGLVYSAYEKAFFIWTFDCTGQNNPGDPVPADAIQRYAFDYTTD